MKNKQNQDRDEDFSQSSTQIDQNAPQKQDTKAENSINYTTINDDFNQNSVSQNNDTSSEIADPVSNFNNTNSTAEREISFSLKEDNLLFERLFPGVLRENVEKEETFKLFSRFAPKNTPFVSIYSDYLALVNRISDSAIKKYLVNEENKRSSAGSLASGSNQSEFYSREQVLKMSREQIAKNYDKIRKSQEKW